MQTALILDQNPAIQAQATHCVTQLGLKPIIQAGDPLQLVQELEPKIIIAPYVKEQITPLLDHLAFSDTGLILICGKDPGINLRLCKVLIKPFRSDALQQALKDLLETPKFEPQNFDVSLKVSDGLVLELIKLFLSARSVSFTEELNNGVNSDYIIADTTEPTEIPYSENLGELISISPSDGNIAKNLTKKLRPLLKTPKTARMPVSPAEKKVITKALLNEIEETMQKSVYLRARNWTAATEELELKVLSFFDDEKK